MAARQARNTYGLFNVWHKNGQIFIQVNPQDRVLVINNLKELQDLLNSFSAGFTQHWSLPIQHQQLSSAQQQPQNQTHENQTQQHQPLQKQTYSQIVQHSNQLPPRNHQSQHQPPHQHLYSQQPQQPHFQRVRINNNSKNNSYLQAPRDPRQSFSPRFPPARTFTQTPSHLPSILDPRFSVPPPQIQLCPSLSPAPITHPSAPILSSTTPYSSLTALPIPSGSHQNVNSFPPSGN